jgi:hypothetical protein
VFHFRSIIVPRDKILVSKSFQPAATDYGEKDKERDGAEDAIHEACFDTCTMM